MSPRYGFTRGEKSREKGGRASRPLEGEIFKPGRRNPLPSRRHEFWLGLFLVGGSVLLWGSMAYGIARSLGFIR